MLFCMKVLLLNYIFTWDNKKTRNTDKHYRAKGWPEILQSTANLKSLPIYLKYRWFLIIHLSHFQIWALETWQMCFFYNKHPNKLCWRINLHEINITGNQFFVRHGLLNTQPYFLHFFAANSKKPNNFSLIETKPNENLQSK